jgi:hypothetical protein
MTTWRNLRPSEKGAIAGDGYQKLTVFDQSIILSVLICTSVVVFQQLFFF